MDDELRVAGEPTKHLRVKAGYPNVDWQAQLRLARWGVVWFAAACLYHGPATTHAQDQDDDEEGRPVAEVKLDRDASFEADVLPIFRKSCLACHSQSESEGELVLESVATIMAGGDSGPAIIPGNAEKSLLFQLASHRNEPVMPPIDNDARAKSLSPEQLGMLKLWIDQGAKADSGPAAEKIDWQPVSAEHAPVFAVDVSPSGDLVAAGRGNEIVIYSVPLKKEVARLVDPAIGKTHPHAAHLDVVQSLAFHPGESLLASGGFRCVKLWQKSSTPVSVATIRPEARSVDGNGTYALIRYDDEIVSVELASGKSVRLAISTTAVGLLGANELIALRADGSWSRLACSDLSRLQESAPDAGSGNSVTGNSVIGGAEEASDANKQLPLTLLATSRDGGHFVLGLSENRYQLYSRGSDGAFPIAHQGKLDGGVDAAHVTIANDATVLFGNAVSLIRMEQSGGSQSVSTNRDQPLESLVTSPTGARHVALVEGTAALWDRELKEIKRLPIDLFSRDRVEAAERYVGLCKERHRVAGEDVAEAKRQKEEDEKNVVKSTEELKKTEEAVPEREKALQEKATELANVKAGLTMAEAALQQAKDALTAGEAKIADSRVGDQAEASVAEVVTQSQATQEQLVAAVSQVEAEVAAKKQELGKAEEAEKKARLELEGSQKAIELAKEALVRAEQSVERRGTELGAIEREAAVFAEKVAAAEAGLKQASDEVNADVSQWADAVFSLDDKQLLLLDQFGRVARFDAETGNLLSKHATSLRGKDNGVESGDTGTRLVQATAEQIWLLQGSQIVSLPLQDSWRLVRTLGDPTNAETFVDRVTAVAFSPDGTLLATGGGQPSRSGEVNFFEVSDWGLVSSLPDAHSDVVYDIEFSQQDGTLVSSASDRMVRMIDPRGGKVMRSFEGHTGHVLGVSWRADGRTIASVGADKVVKVWDAKYGTQKKTISGFKKEVTSVQFLGLEDRLVFALGDGQVQSRNSNGEDKPGFGGFGDYVHRVGGSQDGQVIVAAGQDRVVRVWNSKGELQVEYAP